MGLIVDPFGGPGGWAEGLKLLGRDEIGIEWDRDACLTRRAAGHRVIRADVSVFPLGHLHGKVEGLILSPPCQAFSAAGAGAGRAYLPRLLDCIERGDWSRWAMVDPRVWLVLEVGRWVEELDPEWVACEQVPAVQPLWEAYARRWPRFRWWTGKLNSADYGVPQTRTRAFLLGSRVRVPHGPLPTHSKVPGLFTPRWVSMADALGWGAGRVGFPRRDDVGDSLDGYHARDWRGMDEPSFTLTEKGRSWSVDREGATDGEVRAPATVRANNTTSTTGERYERSTDRPAPVVGTGARSWQLLDGEELEPPVALAERQAHGAVRPIDAPAMTITGSADNGNFAWVHERPATTVCGDPRLWPPGHKVNQADIDALGEDEARARYGDRAGTGSVKLSIRDALVLQSFRPDYPVQGNRTSAFRQVGDAVPPRWAAHLLAPLLGVEPPTFDD